VSLERKGKEIIALKNGKYGPGMGAHTCISMYLKDRDRLGFKDSLGKKMRPYLNKQVWCGGTYL
jgi:hypothetical protein